MAVKKNQKMKRGIALILCAVLTLCLFPANVWAASSGENAREGGSVTWQMADDGTLTISGSGVVEASAFCDNNDITSVVIEEGVTGIGTQAFARCANITSISFPETLTTLGGASFVECTGLTEVTIPQSLETAETSNYNWGDRGPFYNCSNLRTVTFAGKRREIPDNIMRGSGVTDIVWPDGVERLGEWSFEGCQSLVSVEVPDTVKEIGVGAFAGCIGLNRIILSRNLEKIESQGFARNSGLSRIEFPEGIKTLGGASFVECTGLTEVTIPQSLETAEISNYNWGDRGPFYNCSNLQTVTFAGKRREIPDNIMRGSGVTDIVWPDGVERLGEWSFEGCQSLVSVEVPDTVKEIGVGAFAGCTRLNHIILSRNLEKIESQGFARNPGLSRIEFPEGIKTLGGASFVECTGLTEVTIPQSLETAETSNYNWGDRGPFYNCSNLRTVTFAGERETIPDQIMRESGVTWINWPKKVKTIGKSAFGGCSNLDSVRIPDSVTNVGESAFSGCSSLNSITMSDSMETIGRSAFENCTSLNKVVLPIMLKEIGRTAFKGCTNLSELYMQKKVTVIGNDAFKDDANLEISAPKYSDSTVLLIDRDINMAFSDLYHAEEASDVVDWTVTSYEMSDVSASGYTPMTLKYAVKEKYQDSVSDLKLVIGASPVSCITNMKADGNQIPYEADKNGHVIVPLEKTEGTATIYMAPNDYGKIASYVKLEYKKGGTSGSSLLGAVSETTSCLTLGVNDNVSYEEGASSVTVPVSGYAVKQKEVNLYLDDELVGTVTASLNGVYKTEITLDRPEDYKAYTIKAVSENRSGDEVSIENRVHTVLAAPVLTEAALYIEAHEYKGGSATFDILDGGNKIKYITFQPGKKYQFRLNYEHADRVKRVFVVSTRGGVRKLLEATWDESAGAYLTHGYFDNDSSYVPGNLSVEYVMKGEKSSVSEDGEIVLSNREQAQIPDKWKTAVVNENTQTASDYEAEIVLGDGDTLVYSYDQMSFTEFADSLRHDYIEGSGPSTIAGSFLGAKDKTASGSSAPPMTQSDISELIDILEATGDQGEEYAGIYNTLKSFGFIEYITGEADLGKDLKTLVKFDYSADDIVAYIVDPSQCDNNIMKYVLKKPQGAVKKSIVEMIGDKNAGNFLYTMGGSVVEFEETAINLLWAKTAILSDPSLTEAQRQAKLAQLDQMRDIACEKLVMQYLSAALTTAGVMSSGTGIGLAFVVLAKVIDNCIIPMIESGDFDKFLQGDISLKTLVIRWILDPSGYVYEGVTSNRLSGVRTTLYYKPSADSAGETLWDASEYDQDNPLYTDEKGCYAWDVPEGYWRVKYEKSGYETAYSEWMPVPPPQTDVNIAMMPTAEPKVESIYVYNDCTVISFDQYMDPASISNIELVNSKNSPVRYTVSYDKSETDAEGKSYAKTFTLVYDGAALARGEELTVKVSEKVKSSASKPVQSHAEVKEAKNSVSMIIDNVIHVKHGDSFDIPYETAGAEQADVSVTIENPDLVELVTVTRDDTGKSGKITVKGLAYGSTRMRVILEGTGVEKLIDIKVDTYSSSETKAPTEKPGQEAEKPEKPGQEPQQPNTQEPQQPNTQQPQQPRPQNQFKNGATVTTTLGRYQVVSAKKKTAKLVSVKNKKATKLVIPATVKIEGVTCKVTEVGPNVMKGNARLTKVVLGTNIVTIGKNAFHGCKKLKTVEVKGKALKNIKSGSFKKTSSKLKFRAKKLTKKQRKALQKKLRRAGNKKGVVK